MKACFDPTGSIAGFADLLAQFDEDPEVGSIVVFACDENAFTPADCSLLLQRLSKPVAGGLFPQIIVGSEHYGRGTVMIGLPCEVRCTVIKNISDPEQDLVGAVEGILVPGREEKTTVVVLVDGFAARISALIDALFENFGLLPNYLGGGAGSLSLKQMPCVMTPEGLLEDAAIIVDTGLTGGIGVAHGWEVISDPIKVTASDRNTILELNYRPAFDVYREVVEPRAGEPLIAEDFFRVAKGFPFGLRKMGSEVVVRDPLMVGQNGSLVCVGEVPVNAFVHILQGETERLIAAARKASGLAEQALKAQGGQRQGRIFMDCISRVLFMEDRFAEELAEVDDGLPMVGALTLGEIANSGQDYLEFYNKTAVVGLFDLGANRQEGGERTGEAGETA